MLKKRIILASKSPRRKELLSQIGIEYECMVSEKEEIINDTVPKNVVESLSLQKAQDIYESLKNAGSDDFIVIGADTVVALKDTIMGKPKDDTDAKRMLKSLSGQSHSVWTGVTLINVSKGEKTVETFAKETKVFMYELSDEEIDEYVASKEPKDKAGAYAIQGLGAKFIQKIEGDYNNVVGLPVSEIYQKIKQS